MQLWLNSQASQKPNSINFNLFHLHFFSPQSLTWLLELLFAAHRSLPCFLSLMRHRSCDSSSVGCYSHLPGYHPFFQAPYWSILTVEQYAAAAPLNTQDQWKHLTKIKTGEVHQWNLCQGSLESTSPLWSRNAGNYYTLNFDNLHEMSCSVEV